MTDHPKPRLSRAARPLATAALLALLAPVALAGSAGAALSAPGTDPFAAPGTYTEANLAADRTSENYFYRIPALAHLGNGVVLASWDARPNSAADAPNANSIVMRRSTDNGKTFGEMTTIAAGHLGDAETPKYGYSDPSFVVDAQTNTVFAFFVYSKDQGFHGSTFGNDDADRNVISAAVVSSGDGGVSWSEPRLITDVAKPGADATPEPGDVKSTFATSGAGIQLRYGAHAGRLVQQYAGRVMQADGSTPIQAYSVYSDDHGQTWERGEFIGTGMDENKVVELSDGRVMLNSRDSNNGGLRKVAISSDGGHSYSPVQADTELVDPTNNAHVTRMFPEAAEGSAEAKMLLYTGANHPTERRNVSARVSCDDGESWPGLRTIRSGFSAYSVATALDDGLYGVFYEGSYTNDLPLATFDQDWLNVACAPLSAAPLALDAGGSAEASVRIANQEATALSGTLTLTGPDGWDLGTADLAPLAAGAEATLRLPVTAPATANGTVKLQARFTAADGRTSHGTLAVAVKGQEIVSLEVSGKRTDGVRDLAAAPYAAGEKLPYSFHVANTGNTTTWVVPTEGNFTPLVAAPVGQSSPAGNCRYSSLAAGASYDCATPRHTVTEAEVADGFFVPASTWTAGRIPDYATVVKKYSVDGGEVDLLVRAPGLATSASAGTFTDEDGNGHASAGDTVRHPAVLSNTGNVRLTGIRAGDQALAGALAPGATLETELVHELTAQEALSGQLAERTVQLAASNGNRQATAQLALGPVQLPLDPEAWEPTDVETQVPATSRLSLAPEAGAARWDGDFSVVMELPRGTNASVFRLFEDGRLIHGQQLKADSPRSQRAVVGLTGRADGNRRYTAELQNAAGTSTSLPLRVTVDSGRAG
ncbi:glycoside hydrolase [Paeniglutamicibacter sp. ABSL32-1]|uniref:sialidase family protein n=1 Tax=Paeniglutamicibacter quisquiliarum TaxID=2849498 RepID=UPI001C2D1833|nr:sialidase family protein [Paeniglutamicibacter quisquiliarum]MBV1779976.1 glycoside hydrolase [Paeniglutamicibacter quisquiliarum]